MHMYGASPFDDPLTKISGKEKVAVHEQQVGFKNVIT